MTKEKIELGKVVHEGFRNHLNSESNHRILFSGKFGLGKSHFLRDFFENNQEYEVFFLRPIKYQISPDQDVVDLIKYDILIELLQKGCKFEDDVDKAALQIEFRRKNALDIMASFASCIPALENLGRPFKDLLGFKNLEKKFIENELEKTEQAIIEKFKDSQETDILSEILKRKIKEIKKEKKSILVLDDMDRIYPEHIFRILNVFGAYFHDEETQINKFGFDKVMIVGDYNNIKSIFHHKFGQKADFSGYINKFFSHGVYHFSLSEMIAEIRVKIYDTKSQYNDLFFKIIIHAIEKNFLVFRNFEKIWTTDIAQSFHDLESVIKKLICIFDDQKNLIKFLNDHSGDFSEYETFINYDGLHNYFERKDPNINYWLVEGLRLVDNGGFEKKEKMQFEVGYFTVNEFPKLRTEFGKKLVHYNFFLYHFLICFIIEKKEKIAPQI